MKKKTAFAIGTTFAVTAASFGISQLKTHSPFEIIELRDASAVEKVEDDPMGGGKCGAGKCGNEKRFETVDVDPAEIRDKLVKARDGQCGLEGDGLGEEEKSDFDYKCAQGTCA